MFVSTYSFLSFFVLTYADYYESARHYTCASPTENGGRPADRHGGGKRLRVPREPRHGEDNYSALDAGEAWLAWPDERARETILRERLSALPRAFPPAIVEMLARNSQDLSGADLKAVVEEAKLLYAHAMANGAESAPWGGSFSVP